MRYNYKLLKKTLIGLFLLILLVPFLGLIPLGLQIQLNYKELTEFDENHPNSSYTRPPFTIDDNGEKDWSYYESNYDWCTYSDGTYYIEDLDINGGSNDYCIYIRDSTVLFIIRNSEFHDVNPGSSPYGGIFLNNVTNGKIIECEISNNKGNGIYLNNSHNIIIEENNIINCQFKSVLNDYEGSGILLRYSHNNIIRNNTCLANENNGIYIRESNNITIEDNTCSGNNNGIEVSINNLISINNNTCSDNSANGIRIINVMDISFSHNIIKANGDWGLFLSDCLINTLSYNLIWNNAIQANQHGIWMYEVKCTQIIGNNIADNIAYGIFLIHDSSYNTIIQNQLSNNGLYCICYYNDCINNIFDNSGCTAVNLNPGSGNPGGPTDNPFIYLFSILFLLAFIGIISGLGYFSVFKRKKMRMNGIEIDNRGTVVMRDGTNLFDQYESEKPKFIRPVEVKPYEFYCFTCEKKYIGHEVFCSTCGQRMKLYDTATATPLLVGQQKNNNNKCILCYDSNCPTCNAKMNGEESCFEECPYCENVYHKHCWDKTMHTFGKCGFCLETPPSELMPPE